MKKYYLLSTIILFCFSGCYKPDNCPFCVDPKKPLPNKSVKVISVVLTRNRIRLGESTDLVITLDNPAPDGGFSSGLNSENDGAEDTFNPVIPHSFTISKGLTKGTIKLQTQRVSGAGKIVLFYVGTRINPVGDTLHIDP